jgi:hypothetical protein
MKHRNLAKADIKVGDILWLRRLPHDYGDDDYDIYDVFAGLDAGEADTSYEAQGLDRGFCNHPCIVVDLMDGKDGDDTKVAVCIVSVFEPT